MEIMKKSDIALFLENCIPCSYQKRMIPYQWYSIKYFYHAYLTYCHTRQSNSYTIQSKYSTKWTFQKQQTNILKTNK